MIGRLKPSPHEASQIDMNQISFGINHDAEWRAIRIFIDDLDLIDLLREFELQFDNNADAKSSIAGGYEGLSAKALHDSLSNTPNAFLSNGSKSLILDCECGCVGCWSLLVNVEDTGKEILWSDFEQIHRRKEGPSFWDYSAFPTFKFAKLNYETELKKLRALTNETN